MDAATIPSTMAALSGPAEAGCAAASAINFWIADEGYLVAWESKGMGGPGGDTSIQVTGVDDPANKVEHPS